MADRGAVQRPRAVLHELDARRVAAARVPADGCYRYVVLVGTPPTAPPSPYDASWSVTTNQDLWYVAEAYGDLNDNHVLSTFGMFSGSINALRIVNEVE